MATDASVARLHALEARASALEARLASLEARVEPSQRNGDGTLARVRGRYLHARHLLPEVERKKASAVATDKGVVEGLRWTESRLAALGIKEGA